jgi:hypothetical protein
VLGFGPLLGLLLICAEDLANHLVSDKLLIMMASILLAGPAWGFFSGLAYWHIKMRRGVSTQGS